MNHIFDSTEESYSIRHLTDRVRSVNVSQTNVLSVEYTVYIHFVRYTSVSHMAKSFS